MSSVYSQLQRLLPSWAFLYTLNIRYGMLFWTHSMLIFDVCIYMRALYGYRYSWYGIQQRQWQRQRQKHTSIRVYTRHSALSRSLCEYAFRLAVSSVRMSPVNECKTLLATNQQYYIQHTSERIKKKTKHTILGGSSSWILASNKSRISCIVAVTLFGRIHTSNWEREELKKVTIYRYQFQRKNCNAFDKDQLLKFNSTSIWN